MSARTPLSEYTELEMLAELWKRGVEVSVQDYSTYDLVRDLRRRMAEVERLEQLTQAMMGPVYLEEVLRAVTPDFARFIIPMVSQERRPVAVARRAHA